MRSSTLSGLILLLAAGALATEPVWAAGRGGGRSGAGKGGGHRGHHHHNHRHFFGATGGVFLGYGYYAGGYPGAYYPGYAVMEPWGVPYYIERSEEVGAGAGWLFCPGANAYFPTVIECASGWIGVPAQP